MITQGGSRPLLAEPEWRVEGPGKVTGAAVYAADVARPGMLHAAFVGSPYPHARVVRVDLTNAYRVPGVRAIVTGADTRPAHFGRHLQDWPVLAWDRVRFIGDRVAAIAADTREAAEEAARVVDVTYEPLPAVLDPDSALEPGAPILHEDPSSYTMIGGPKRPPMPHPNLQGRMFHEHGDVAAGFARAVRIFEHSFETARTHNGYLEPRACLVWLDDRVVHVLTTNKTPFWLRQQMAATLGIPAEQIEVESVTIGGDFGGKGLSLDEYACYFLARATGRPVRSVLRYADELQIGCTRRAARIRLRTGVDADGRFTAHEARVLFDCGAYGAGAGTPRILPNASLLTLGGYRVPAARVEALGVYTNQIMGGSVRAPGQPQLTFAAESHIDEMARALGRDPLAFREDNLARDGDPNVNGEAWHGSEMPELIAKLRERLAERVGPGPGRGRGIAIGFRHQGLGRAAVQLALSPDGHVVILTGVPDQGTGVYTVMQRIVATELEIPPEHVVVRTGTTSQADHDDGTGGSKSTIVHGGAALDAARRLIALLAERAPGKPFVEAARIVAPVTVTGSSSQERHTYSACAQVVDVEVDAETGAFRILGADVIADVGNVINPLGARGQIEGGFVFGLGQTLTEEAPVIEGRAAAANLGDYKLMTVNDVPPFDVVMHTGAPGFGPYGAKGVGEHVHSVVGPAVANAIMNAVGARVTSLPITAEKVLYALQRKKSDD